MIEFDFTYSGELFHATMGRRAHGDNGAPNVSIVTLPTGGPARDQAMIFGDLTMELPGSGRLARTDPPSFAISTDLEGTGIPEALEEAGLIAFTGETDFADGANHRIAQFNPGVLDSVPTMEELPAEIERYITGLDGGGDRINRQNRLIPINEMIKALDLGELGDRCYGRLTPDQGSVTQCIYEVADEAAGSDSMLLEWIYGEEGLEYARAAESKGIIHDERGIPNIVDAIASGTIPNDELLKAARYARSLRNEDELARHRSDICKFVALKSIRDSGTRAVPESWARDLFEWIDAAQPDHFDDWETMAPCGTWSPEDLDLTDPETVRQALQSGIDLYNTTTGEFVFEYNDYGSIATTTVRLDDPALLERIDNDGFDFYEDTVVAENYTCYITDSNECLIEEGEPLPRPDDPAFDATQNECNRIASEKGWGPATPHRIREAIAEGAASRKGVRLDEVSHEARFAADNAQIDAGLEPSHTR